MTLSELTHVYQHLAAQAGLDRQWAARVESVITDHALWLDKHSRAGNSVAADLASFTETVASGAKGETRTNTTGASGSNDPPADSTDARLRAHVQAQDVAVTARLDAAEAALRELITSLDTSLRAHVEEAVAVTQRAVTTLGEMIHLLDTAGGPTAFQQG